MGAPNFLHLVEHNVRRHKDQDPTKLDGLKNPHQSVGKTDEERLVFSCLVRKVDWSPIDVLSQQGYAYLLFLIYDMIVFDSDREQSFHFRGV